MSATTTTSTIIGNVFIIPNQHSPLTEASDYYIKRQHRQIDELQIPEEYKLVIGDTPVQLWCATPDVDASNWQDHGIPELNDRTDIDNGTVYFPGYIPARCLANITEGTTFHLGRFTLTAKQLDYRYRMFGPFEAAFASVTNG